MRPPDPGSKPSAAEGDDSPSSSAELRLLIADDDDDFRIAAAELLRLEGFDVVELKDGQAAFDHALSETFDVVLLDHRMPGIMGGDVYDRLRRLRPDLPVVLMTAAMDPQGLARAVGAPLVLNKPFDVDELMEAVEVARSTARPQPSSR